MPKSKRSKQIELTKTKKHGLEGKKRLYEEIRKSVDSYCSIFVFSVNDMRNAKMKTVREQWKHSRFFIGKNKVMAKALGRSEAEEYMLNLHKIGDHLKGQRGLFFTNQPVEEVLEWFGSYSEADFARSGNIATEDVHLKEGPLPQFPHSLESYLRHLGLPTTLQKGVIHLVKDQTVCTAGEVLSPETARILKLLGYEMAEFRVRMECVWNKDGSFRQLTEDQPGAAAMSDDEEEEQADPIAKISDKEEEEQEALAVHSNKMSDGEEEEEPKLSDPSPKMTRSRAAATHARLRSPLEVATRSAKKKRPACTGNGTTE